MKTNGKPGKKTYDKPELVIYGDLLQVTQIFGNMGAADGGTGSTRKTA